MKHSRLWLSASIIALVIIIGFVISVPHTRDVPGARALNVTTPGVPEVALRDVFKKGVHTISGSVEAPDACSTVSAEASLTGDASSTQSILVAVSIATDAGICLELPTRETFQTTLAAPAQLPLFVTVNGVTATTSEL